MDVSQPNPSPSKQGEPPAQTSAAEAHPRSGLEYGTSDYGTLGPGSDFELNQAALSQSESVSAQFQPPSEQKRVKTLRIGPPAAAAAGVLLAVLVGNVGTARAAWQHFAGWFSANGETGMVAPPPGNDSSQQDLTERDLTELEHEKPQTQAEALLERAVNDSGGALEQISSRVEGWQGKIKWNSQIANLTTAALNSRDLRVRQSGIQVELAAYGLSNNSASLDYVLRMAESSDHEKKVWALWALGLLGNRGVGADLAIESLTNHLKDADEDSRRWAVGGLALVGSPETVAPLLRVMHDDPSPTVRESAACSLAESGMLTREQRFAAVPQLLSYTDDPALDEQTRTWAFQALHDITGQRFPNDAAEWRSWYRATNGK